MKLRILLLLIFIAFKVAAQDDHKLKVYKINMKNGSQLIGTIVSQNDSIVVLNVPELGELRTERRMIDKMVPYNLPRDQIRARLYPLLTLRGLRLPQRQTVLRALDLYVAYEIDFEDALIVAHMERQAIRELYSYDRDFDQVPGVNRQEP